MRVYIIGTDGITLCRTAATTLNNGEFAVSSNEELRAAPLSAKRLLAVERSARCRKAKESWRSRRADLSAVVGNRGLDGREAPRRHSPSATCLALISGSCLALLEPDPEFKDLPIYRALSPAPRPAAPRYWNMADRDIAAS